MSQVELQDRSITEHELPMLNRAMSIASVMKYCTTAAAKMWTGILDEGGMCLLCSVGPDVSSVSDCGVPVAKNFIGSTVWSH